MLRICLLCLVLLLTTSPVSAALMPTPPAVAAEGYILVDAASGHVVASANADQPLEPASLTKVMTAYVVFRELAAGNLRLGDTTRVSEKAWRMPGSRMFIEVNTEVDIESLLLGMIVQSGNDASVALAEHVAGSEDAFAMLMNQHAARLGMDNSHFTNSSGLPGETHITTARDMATLARALIAEFPQYYDWYSQREYTYNGITQHNRNRLLWRDDSVDGLKTGHTSRAGYCLLASAQRDGMRLISVVLGTTSENARAVETQKLFNYGFRFFETVRLIEAGREIGRERIWQGASDELLLAIDEPLLLTIPRGQRERIRNELHFDGPLQAPVVAGEKVGTLRLFLGSQLLDERPLVAHEAVAAGSLLRRGIDRVRLMMQGD